MMNLRDFIQKIQNFFLKKIPFCDMSEMLCFLLGIYGERFFSYMYVYLKKVSPEMFCFICLICIYLFIAKFMRH